MSYGSRGNAVIGVHINAIEDMRISLTSARGNAHTAIGYCDNSPIYFDDIADGIGIYDYVVCNGYDNMGT